MSRKQITLTVLILGTGVLGILLGARYLLGFELLHTEGGLSCKSICGLGLIFNTFFSGDIGVFITGLLWLIAGCWLTYFGFKALRNIN